MARFEMLETGLGAAGAIAQADILFELGMMHATGRDCEVDVVAAHKWFNIAAIKGSNRAAELRAELSAAMTKPEIIQALREAREWMTTHSGIGLSIHGCSNSRRTTDRKSAKTEWLPRRLAIPGAGEIV